MKDEKKKNILKLIIKDINGYEYIFEDEYNNEFKFNFEFLDIEKPLQIKDELDINSELLNPEYEGYSTNYTFGSLDSIYGRNNLSLDDIDVIKVVTDKKEIYLKRLYG